MAEAAREGNGGGASGGGGGWTGRSRGGGFGYRFFIGLVRRAGIGTAYAFLALVVPYFVLFAPRARRAAWWYWRRIHGCGRWVALRRVFSHFHCFGQTLIDRIAITGGVDGGFRFEFGDGFERFLRLLDGGGSEGGSRGVVMIGAHVGCWEAGARFFGHYAARMNIVLHDGEAAAVRAALKANTAGEGYKTIAVGDDGLDDVLKIKAALDSGECVCFQGDRFMAGSESVEALFLGRRARFPRGPFLLGARMKTPVVFFFAMRERGRRYRFHFTEARAGNERELLEQYIEAAEQIVRRYPKQWFNFYKFWE